MARPEATDSRFDFRGGLNTAVSEELLDLTELRNCQNGRVGDSGSIRRRLATQRIHTNAIGSGADVMGLFQWDAPAGKQVVAISGGNFYHKLDAAADFTEIASALSTTNKARFVPWRIGVNIVLYFADGALRKWDGTTLTTAIAGAPDLVCITPYKGRLFGLDATKKLWWSAIGAPEEFSLAEGAGYAEVETFDTEPLSNLIVIGSSLVLFKEDTIARFTGKDKRDIRIDTETEGVSPSLGLRARHCMFPIELASIFLSDRGAYICDEANVQVISDPQVKDLFKAANGTYVGGSVGVYNKGGREGWISFPHGTETENDTTLVYLPDLGTWCGPYVFNSFGCCTLAEYERADETHSVLIGGYDGFIREADVAGLGGLDDVLRDGTGGNEIELKVELPPPLFGDPRRIKDMGVEQSVEADLGTLYTAGPPIVGGKLVINWTSEFGSGSVTVYSRGPGIKDYKWKSEAKGRRIILEFVESSGEEDIELAGFLHTALMGSIKS